MSEPKPFVKPRALGPHPTLSDMAALYGLSAKDVREVQSFVRDKVLAAGQGTAPADKRRAGGTLVLRLRPVGRRARTETRPRSRRGTRG